MFARPGGRGPDLARVASLLVVQLAAGLWAASQGFTHVSDDDYARVVLAERFAHAPALDPSGTSWLPWPFWLNGGAMMAFGRSLETAHALGWALGLASVVVGYAGLRVAKVSPTVALLATLLVTTSPWDVWLGIATVPEALTAALVFAGAMTMAAPGRRALGAAALLVASLSRYEAWPVCAVLAAWSAVAALREDGARRRDASIAVVLSAAGPATWLLWNLRAHGSALAFLTRVAAFHATHAASDLAGGLLVYPRAILEEAPAIVLAGALGVLGGRAVLARWAGPLLAALGLLAFLAAGEAVGGAPTHHPVRAVLAVLWILAGFGVDGVRAFVVRHAWGRPKREAWAVGFGVAASLAVTGSRIERLRDPPGEGPGEDRAAQVSLGQRLRRDDAREVRLVPCAYEHFAVIAAFGAPERVTTLAPSTPGEGPCPEVEIR